MVSWTYPAPSDLIFPISKETNKPKAYFFSLNAIPICLTISPLLGIGTLDHAALASNIPLSACS